MPMRNCPEFNITDKLFNRRSKQLIHTCELWIAIAKALAYKIVTYSTDSNPVYSHITNHKAVKVTNRMILQQMFAIFWQDLCNPELSQTFLPPRPVSKERSHSHNSVTSNQWAHEPFQGTWIKRSRSKNTPRPPS